MTGSENNRLDDVLSLFDRIIREEGAKADIRKLANDVAQLQPLVDAAPVQVHVEHAALFDVTVGRAMQFELEGDAIIPSLESIVRACVRGRVVERVAFASGGGIARSRGVLYLEDGKTLRSRHWDTTENQFFARKVELRYSPYGPE